ncbi:MAG: hypothetical protein ACOCSD_01305 [Halolamina sp.]
MSRQSRRAMLAAAGTTLATALAGCTELGTFWGEKEVEYDESALAELPDDLPEVPDTTPVHPTEEHVSTARDRIQSLLDGTDVSRIPNEVVRDELDRAAGSARDALEDDEDDEPSRIDHLAGLTYSRSDAMFADAGLAAYDDDLTADDVESRRERRHREAESFLAEYSSIGPSDDPVVALAQHHTITEWGHTGVRMTEPDQYAEYENTVLHVAELAQDVEWGRAHTADARRLHEHYASTLDDPRDYGDHFGSVAATLLEDVEAHAEQPDWDELEREIDRDISNTAGESLLDDLLRRRWIDAQNTVERHDDGRDAAAVVFAMRTLTADRALAAARTAVEDGEYDVPQSVEPIAAERSAAVDGFRTLLATAPELLAHRLAHVVYYGIRNADGTVEDGGAFDPGRSLYAEYAVANQLAAAAPPVVQRVADAVTD